jgi:y4mF family transcriptional regulator
MKNISSIAQFIKEKRKNLKITQEELAFKAGVGLRVVRELEQGKITLKLDKVNQVLDLFGSEVGVIRKEVTDE